MGLLFLYDVNGIIWNDREVRGVPTGHKITSEERQAIIADFAITGVVRQTARNLGVGETTVSRVTANLSDEEKAYIDTHKKTVFVDRLSELIDKATMAIDMKLDDIIADGEIRAKTPVSQISTTLGTLYDKRALACGDTTVNQGVKIILPEEVNEYAE